VRSVDMPPKPVLIYEDRSLEVPLGRTVQTGYVSVGRVRLACRDRMSVGDVAAAYQKRLSLGDRQPFPCPNGEWEGDVFVIYDGRHEYVAALMLGFETILVAWVA
jgi:hypothetical protein